MLSAVQIRAQVEAALADRIPGALRMAPPHIRPVISSGIPSVDAILDGGLPIGAITEVAGGECSGRTSFTFTFLAHITHAGKVCAWVDTSNALQPESAAAAGVELSHLLWVRCGAQPVCTRHERLQKQFALPEKYFAPPAIKKGLHGGGCGGHPRGEAIGLSTAVSGFLRSQAPTSEPSARVPKSRARSYAPALSTSPDLIAARRAAKPWSRIEQALRITDLLLQAGGFSAIVLDLADIAPEFSSRVPLATWYRYRAAAERSQVSFLLLTQHICAKSSAGLVLQLRPRKFDSSNTVFTGIQYEIEVLRRRFNGAVRKPPQKATNATWKASTTWAGCR